MSNSKVTVRSQILYTDAYSQNAAVNVTVEAPYQAQNHGSIDIPDTTGAGSYDIPFGSVTSATCVTVRNFTGQPVNITVNGGDLAYTGLADGKSFLLTLEAMPDTAIAAVQVTTLSTQTGAGHIAYDVWGDPV